MSTNRLAKKKPTVVASSKAATPKSTPLDSTPMPRLGRHTRSRHDAIIHLPIQDGCVMVVSDQHYWPGPPTVAHRGALWVAKQQKPWGIVNNGDTIDGARISRWPMGSFIQLEGVPTVLQELTASQALLGDFEKINTQYLTWNMGNHDSRYETFLAERVPEYAGITGFHLRDHFKQWAPAWATFIGDQVVIKHRFKGGMYAAVNNALWAGRTVVTGHLHALYAKAITDYNGIRWGIEAGTLLSHDSKASLHYTEANPVNWQPGFVLLHFRDGMFTGPELIYAMPDDTILYRGDRVKV